MLRHRVLDRLPLADEIEHHHRVREQRDEGREDAERDVTVDVGAAQAEDRGRHESGEAEEDAGYECLKPRARGRIMSPSPFIVEWIAADRRDAAARGTARALDVAMGRGRHALALARGGFKTFGVDVSSRRSATASRSGAAPAWRCMRGAPT